MKKISCCIAILLIAAIGLTACGNGSKSKVEARIWSAGSTAKILQDKQYTNSSEGRYKVDVFRNETEGAQVLFTPESDIKEYLFEVSDLYTAQGDKLEKERLKVFHLKYIEIYQSSYLLTSELGWYPDAMLPYATAVKFAENTVKAGNNQALWIEVTPPETQAAGKYTGTFKLTLDGTVFTVPAEVEVYDYTLTSASHTKSSFAIDQYWGTLGAMVAGELDTSWEMYEKYVDSLMQYRLNPIRLPAAFDDVDGFVEKLLKYYDNPLFTHYNIPYVQKFDNDYNDAGIDYDLHKVYLKRLAAESVRLNCNLLEKAGTYFEMIDEAVLNGLVNRANNLLNKVIAFHGTVADELESELDTSPELKAAIVNSVRNMRHKFVDEYTADLTADAMYVPQTYEYNSEVSRAKYSHNDEKWWYTVASKGLSPAYQIDDDFLGPRVMSWMQYEYGVVGNLYWSTTINSNITTKVPLADYYTEALRMGGTNALNGCGFLFYPGKPYDIEGPVASLRLAAIRDGLEEYELLYALEQEYESLAQKYNVTADFSSVYNLMSARLYNGSQIKASDEVFAQVRSNLARLLISAGDDIVVLSAAEDKAKVVLNVLLPDSVVLAVL